MTHLRCIYWLVLGVLLISAAKLCSPAAFAEPDYREGL
jgi:hypothetical protein